MVPELIDSFWAELLKGEYEKGEKEGTLYCNVSIGDMESTSKRFKFIVGRPADVDGLPDMLAFNCRFGYSIEPEYTEKVKDLIYRLNQNLLIGNIGGLDLNKNEDEVFLYYPLLIIKGTELEALLEKIEEIRDFMAATAYGYYPAFEFVQEKGMSPQEAASLVVDEGYDA